MGSCLFPKTLEVSSCHGSGIKASFRILAAAMSDSVAGLLKSCDSHGYILMSSLSPARIGLKAADRIPSNAGSSIEIRVVSRRLRHQRSSKL